MPELRAAARGLLEASVDAEYRANISALVPTDSPILGVRVPAIRALVKVFHAQHAIDLETAAGLVEVQFATRCRDEMLFGVFLLARFKRQFSAALWPKIDRWIEMLDNWETCDQLAMAVAGEILAKDLSLLPELHRWVRSKDRWRRRCALAITTVLNQKGRRNAEATLGVCALALADGEPIVQKAVAWALREACKHDEPAVFALLSAHRARLHPAILRETAPKLAAAHRAALGAR